MAVPNNTSGQNPPPVPRLTKMGFADPVWARWLDALRNRVLEAVTSVNIASANGFVATVTTSPSGQATVTLSISASGVLKGAGGAIVPAVAGTDFIQAITATAPLSQSGGAVPNISMTQSGAGTNGWLSAADWNTFNGKVSSVLASLPLSSSGGGNPTISMTQASTSSNGWLSQADWNTFNNKLSGNQTITLSGDVTGSGTTAITTTLAASGVTAGSYGSATQSAALTIDAKGRVTLANVATITPAFSNITGKPTTAGGYGIVSIDGIPIGATTPSTGAFTTLSATGAITPSQTAGIVGTTTNNNANAGSVGEYQQSSTAGTSLTSGTAANVNTISLTAGDWDVQGTIAFVDGTGTAPTTFNSSISLTSNTAGGLGARSQFNATFGTAVAPNDVLTPTVRVSIAATTTVYLVGLAFFTGGTMTANGFLRARRIR